MATENDDEQNGPEWDDDFDADRARELITKLRGETKAAKANGLTEEQQEQLNEYQLLREASQTEAERIQAELESVREQAGQVPTLTAQNMRLQVAVDKGLNAQLAARLQGSTKEELEADADTLLGMLAPQPGAQQGLRPNPAQGTSGAGAPSIEDQIAAARKAGDVKLALQLNSVKLANLPH